MTRPRQPYLAELEHPGVIAAVSVIGLAVSYLVAARLDVPRWELRVTEWINGMSDVVATALDPIMQLGTLGGPISVAVVVVIVKRDWLLSAAIVATGVATWFAAKGVKQIVERDRPSTYLPDVVVRESDGTGLGYVSGHSAVAASAAVMAMAVIPPRWRPLAALLAGLVGIARIVHGVHLPADVVGGWSLGALLGLAGLGAADQIRGRPPGAGTIDALRDDTDAR